MEMTAHGDVNETARNASVQTHTAKRFSLVRPLKELFAHQELIRYLVGAELKVRYRGSVLGFLWTLLNPILLMIVLWAVFSQLRRFRMENYALYLLAGLMVWTFFQQSVNQGMQSLVKNKGLFSKIYLPKLVFPVTTVTSNLVNFAFFLTAYLLIAAFTSVGWHTTVPLIFGVAAMLYLLSAGAALLLSTLNVFYRDFGHMIGPLLRAMFYVTPIIYPPEMLGETGMLLLRFNPVFYPTVAAKSLLYHGQMPTAEIWLGGFGWAVVSLLFGLWVFIRNEEKFIYYA